MSGKTVLITGASSGIGYELAKIFAEQNYNLILVARNKEKLHEAMSNLKRDTISILVLAKDISDPQTPKEIFTELKEKGISVDFLINNAGFATYGYFTETDIQEELNELSVNIVSLTLLTKLFVQDMVERKYGKILNIASTAAYLPGPLMAVYFASKAYVLSFSEALANELKGTGVTVSVLCPGPTNTGFAKRAELESAYLYQETMSAAEVARAGYVGLMRNQVVIVPGIKNKILTLLARIVPRSLSAKVVRRLQEIYV